MEKLTVKDDSLESKEWKTFLNSFESVFSEYEIQKNRNLYNVANLEDWGSNNKTEGITLTESNIDLFFKKVENFNISGYETMKNTSLTEKQIDELNHVLDLTLKHSNSFICDKTSTFVKGNYVLVSEVFNETMAFKEKTCEDISTIDIKYINIFATDTIFFDQDIQFPGKHVSITAIAPKWEVIGNRKIVLSGVDGKPQEYYPNEPTPTTNKSKNGNNGKDGKPGLPGGSGGNFFGIGDVFVSGSNLTITVNGGRGGWGQDGGDGVTGTNGKDAVMPESSMFYTFIKIPPTTCGHADFCNEYYRRNTMTCKGSVKTYWYTGNKSATYTLYGTEGGKGGKGGDGGKGGNGGRSGNIRLLELKGNSMILKNNGDGENGKDGRGGEEGIGGKHGDDLYTTCTYMEQSYIGTVIESKFYLQSKKNNGKEPSGGNGIDGAYTIGMLKPEEKVADIEATVLLNEYKSYLRENLLDNFNKTSLMNFSSLLDESDKVIEIYDVHGLVMDLKYLETQIPELGKSINFIPFYKSLLNKISNYASKESKISMENKKVLSYLYTATLSKIYKLQEDSESNLIVDIEGYLNLVTKNIEDLKDLQKAKYKSDIIERYNESYKDNINKKIEEAKLFIEKLKTSTLPLISTQIDYEIDKLIDKTIEMQKEAEKEQKKLIELKEKLSDTLKLRGVFSLVKNFGQIISLLGPAGLIAGTFIEQFGSIGESLALDDKNKETKILILPDAVKQNLYIFRQQLDKLSKDKIVSLTQLIEEMVQEMSNYPDWLKDLPPKIAQIKKKLNDLQLEELSDKSISTLVEELKLKLKQKLEELKSNIEQEQKVPNSSGKIERKTLERLKREKNDEKKNEASKVLKKYVSALTICFKMGIDMYENNKDNEDKLKILANAIEDADDKYHKLQNYEENLFNSTIPMLKNIKDNLNDIASKLGEKSKVFLSVIRWQVQTVLRDLKLQMQQLTKGFGNIEEDLPRCIEKLEEVMTVLIEVYDSLQNYQEQQNLSNFIADVNSATANNIKINDEKLREIVLELDIAIKSNLILKQYEVAMNSFKQFVFPLAYDYLKKIPSELQLEKNIDNLVFNAVTEVENMASKIVMYKKSIQNYNKYIHTGRFKSNEIYTKPFYVWRNKDNKDMIAKLLSGQQVVVKADVLNSQPYKDAIKFSYIDLTFNSQNTTIQKQINNTIKAFEVTAVHTGNSYYRYENKIYMINSERQTIEFSFVKKPNGDPEDANDVYKMIKNGDFLLSPYTWWKFQLYNLSNDISFEDLSSYADHVDLALEGEGKYVNTRLLDLDLEVDKYYKAIYSEYQSEILKTQENLLKNNNLEMYKYINDYDEDMYFQDGYNETVSSWLSWIQLPDINIIPGAEATELKDSGLKLWNKILSKRKDKSQEKNEEISENQNLKQHRNCEDKKGDKNCSSLCNKSKDIKNGMNSSNNEISSDNCNKFKAVDYSYKESSIEFVNHHNYSCMERESSSSEIYLGLDDFERKYDLVKIGGAIDFHGNLLTGHLITQKLFGKNKFIFRNGFLSPEKEQFEKINKLSTEILPVILNTSNEKFSDDLEDKPQWYRELMSNEYGDVENGQNILVENFNDELSPDFWSVSGRE